MLQCFLRRCRSMAPPAGSSTPVGLVAGKSKVLAQTSFDHFSKTMCCKIWTCFLSLAKLQLRIWKSYQTVIHKENYWCHSLRKPVEGKLQKDRDFWAGDSYWSRRSSFWDSGTREHCKLNYELIFITFILWSFPFDMDFFFKKLDCSGQTKRHTRILCWSWLVCSRTIL